MTRLAFGAMWNSGMTPGVFCWAPSARESTPGSGATTAPTRPRHDRHWSGVCGA
jgi:hypothetical protein